MAVYDLIVNGGSVQTIAFVNKSGGANQGVKANGPDDNPNSPTLAQAFTARLDGTGSCSATVQPVVSMDGDSWLALGSAQLVSGATVTDAAPALAGFVTSAPYPYFGAYVASISGTNAKVNLKMSA